MLSNSCLKCSCRRKGCAVLGAAYAISKDMTLEVFSSEFSCVYFEPVKVFEGGTCNGSEWRNWLNGRLDNVEFFNPVVSDWNEEAQKREIQERQDCDYVLYTLTSKMTGVYSIAEVTEDSVKRPEKTLFCISNHDGEFEEGMKKSLKAVARMVMKNNAKVFGDIMEVVNFLNSGGLDDASFQEEEDLIRIR